MEFKDMIKALREKMIISQDELAKILVVSFVSVNRWENGHYEPTIKLKRRIVQLFKENGIEVN